MVNRRRPQRSNRSNNNRGRRVPTHLIEGIDKTTVINGKVLLNVTANSTASYAVRPLALTNVSSTLTRLPAFNSLFTEFRFTAISIRLQPFEGDLLVAYFKNIPSTLPITPGDIYEQATVSRWISSTTTVPVVFTLSRRELLHTVRPWFTCSTDPNTIDNTQGLLYLFASAGTGTRVVELGYSVQFRGSNNSYTVPALLEGDGSK